MNTEVVPARGWSRLERWVPGALEAGADSIQIVVAADPRQPSGEVVHLLKVGEDEDPAEVVEQIVSSVSTHCEGWPATRFAALKVRAFSNAGKRRTVAPGKTDHFHIVDNGQEFEDDDDDGFGQSTAMTRSPSVQPVMEHGDRRMTAAGALKDVALEALNQVEGGPLIAFLVMQNFEVTNRGWHMADKFMDRMGGTMDALQSDLSDMSERVRNMEKDRMDAVINQKNAEIEVDAERRRRTAGEQKEKTKQDLMKMFGSQASHMLDLLMMKASGLPPNSPELQEQYLRGWVAKNPERAKEMAGKLGMEMGGGVNIRAVLEDKDQVQTLIKAELEKDPKGTLQVLGDLIDTLSEVTEGYVDEDDD